LVRAGTVPKQVLAHCKLKPLSRGVNISDSTKPLNNKLLTLPIPQEDVETKLLLWIRGVVQSNQELVGALKRLRHSYKALLAGKSVTDAEEILWRVEVALLDTERSMNVLASASPRGPNRE
jgi:hypothetical protein